MFDWTIINIEQSVIDFIIQFVATLIGVGIAIGCERKHERSKIEKEVNLIASFIYQELKYNLHQIRTVLDGRLRPPSFDVSYWEIYRNRIGLWNPRNVAQLNVIYNELEKMPTSGWTLLFQSQNWPEVARELMFLENEISRLIQWYDENSELHDSLAEAKEQIDLIDESRRRDYINNYEPKF